MASPALVHMYFTKHLDMQSDMEKIVQYIRKSSDKMTPNTMSLENACETYEHSCNIDEKRAINIFVFHICGIHFRLGKPPTVESMS